MEHGNEEFEYDGLVHKVSQVIHFAVNTASQILIVCNAETWHVASESDTIVNCPRCLGIIDANRG
jgi:hypothetical protein